MSDSSTRWAKIGGLALVPLLSACGGLQPLDAARVRELVPVATAVPVALLDDFAKNGRQVGIADFESRTLTVVLLLAIGEPKDDFRPLPSASGSETTEPWVLITPKLTTWLPGECLRSIDVENEGERAQGSFRFHRAGMFEGFAEFEAERRDGEWTLTRFRLPLVGLETRLQANGTWRSNLPEERELDERDRVRALPRDHRLSVRVVDLDGQPVPGAVLHLGAVGLELREETTDAEGRATFDELPSIEIDLRLHPVQWGRVRLEPHLLAPARERALPNGQDLVLAFRRGVPLRGRALDPEGRGVAGAVVQIASGGTRLDRVETDAEGRWSGSGLADAEHVIDIFSPDRGAGAWKAVLGGVRPSAEEILVRLEPAR
ncbi:MAG: carboxypeptidase regulatory-like domain-containing protein [Planctomycetes bacterium]|nr:carboxypeptidase regulatory-like domain-containing protein [Planctomycetota bacterium]